MVDITAPAAGAINWDVPLNLALTTLESAVTAVEASDAAKLPLAGGTVTGSLAVSGHALGVATPAAHNVLAWAYDPGLVTNSSTATNGTAYLTKMHLAASATATKIYWWVATAAVTATAGQNHVGIYNSAGTLLASTNVDADITSTGLKTTTITGQSLTAGSFYWVGMVFNAATPPGIARMAGLSGLGTATNLGLTAATFRFAINGTGQTALPSPITPSSNAAPAFGGPWAAVGV